MASSSFYEEGSRLLTPGAFEFVLDSELKRAVRSQNFLTLVTVEASREWEGMMVTADDGTLQEVAQIISREVRDTDLLGHTDKGTLALVLLDADFEHSSRVIDRVVVADRELRVPERAADRGRSRLLPDPCRRRRVPEAPGDVAAARELAGRPPFLHRSELREPACAAIRSRSTNHSTGCRPQSYAARRKIRTR